MFPFNQSYKPRRPTPEPTQPRRVRIPVTLPRIKLKVNGHTLRHQPYPPRPPPTPSSPSEPSLDYDHLTNNDLPTLSPMEKIECANPLELLNKSSETPTDEEVEEGTLEWGDLIAVEYRGRKKKNYEWPAIIVPPAHMIDNMLDYPPEGDPTALAVRWIETTPSYSWVPMKGARRLTRTMIDEFLAKTTGPKKLIEAWELAKDPPSPFSYLLEKKYQYHTLMEKYKAL